MSPKLRSSFYYGGFFAAIGLYVPFFNAYLKEIGLTGTEIGWIAMLIPAAQLVLVSPMSALADKLNQRRNMLTFVLAGMSITFFFGQYPTTFWSIVVFYAIYAMFFGVAFSLANGVIASMAARYDFTYGSARVWGSIGFSIISTLGGFFLGRFGLVMMFAVVAVLLWVPVFFSTTLEEPPVEKDAVAQPSIWEVIRAGKLMGLLLPWGFMMIGFGAVFSFEGIAVLDRGGTEWLIGITLAAAAISELPVMPNATRFIDRFGGRQTLMVAYLILTLSFFGYAFVTEAWMMPPVALLRGIGFGVALPATVTLIARRVPTRFAATGQGLIILTNGVAHILANLMAGRVYDLFGSSVLFFICAVCVGIAAVIVGFGSEQSAPQPAEVAAD